MTDKTDALVALDEATRIADKSKKIDRERIVGRAAVAHLTTIRHALAAPAEGDAITARIDLSVFDQPGDPRSNLIARGWVPPAEGDGAALLRTAAEYHYAQAACPRDQFGNTSNHKNPKLEAWHRQIGDAITALTRPAATAVVPEGFVMVPRIITPEMEDAANMRDDDEPLSDWGKVRDASRQAIWDAMIAAAPAAPKGGVVDAIRERLVECRDWFDQQADVISKGGGSTWDMLECREQRDLCKAALATGEQP